MSKPDTVLFLDDHHGIYIPRDFAQCVVRERVKGVSDENFAILEAGPEHEHYWDAWDDVCDSAVITGTDGVVYRLDQDGALWLIPDGMSWSDRRGWNWGLQITLSQSDDDDGTVTAYCEDVDAARRDQSIDGSHWECPRDLTVAYACLSDRPTLVDDLRAAGYDVDDSEYSAPDQSDLDRWHAKYLADGGS